MSIQTITRIISSTFCRHLKVACSGNGVFKKNGGSDAQDRETLPALRSGGERSGLPYASPRTQTSLLAIVCKTVCRAHNARMIGREKSLAASGFEHDQTTERYPTRPLQHPNRGTEAECTDSRVSENLKRGDPVPEREDRAGNEQLWCIST